MITPVANVAAMNAHLAEISTQIAPGAHAVLLLDRAGWHQRGKRLCVPANITLLDLPAYSPELNPMENVWEFLRGNKLSALVWEVLSGLAPSACLPAGVPRVGSGPTGWDRRWTVWPAAPRR